MQESNNVKKSLLTNFLSLSTIQAINVVLPLLTLPYLVRVLGVENFGLVNFSLSIIMYFNILVNFGFDLSATREISIHRDDTKKTSEIFWAISFIKFVLVLISLSVLSLLVLSVETLNSHGSLYYATFGLVIGNLLSPGWYFQGMERMKYLTYITLVSRIIFTLLIFTVVKDSSDYIYVPLINSLGVILGGLYSLWFIYKFFDLQFIIPSKQMVFSQLKGSSHFFLSSAANNGSRYFVITVMGLYFGNTIVGYYAMAEKLFYAFMSASGVVSQTIYPYMSRTKNIVFFKKVFFLVISLSVIILIPTMFFNHTLLKLVFGVENQMLSNIFLIVFSGAIFGSISTLLGYPLLAAFGQTKYANNSIIYASIISILYVAITAIIFKNIYLVSFAIALHSLISALVIVYYIYKTKLYLNSTT